jgi:phosphatidylglycerophosphate synthase
VAGKLSAALQMATVLLVLLGKFWVLPQAFLSVWFWMTAGLTTISGIHYILRALRDATRSQNRPG